MARTTPSSASLGRVTNIISWELMKCKDTLLSFTDYKKASVNFNLRDRKVNPKRMLNDIPARKFGSSALSTASAFYTAYSIFEHIWHCTLTQSIKLLQDL